MIIPCLNEERFIGPCLDSLRASDHSQDLLEILVVDGGSTDRTRTMVMDHQKTNPNVRLLDNPRRSPPAALNVALRNASGSIIVRADAHTTYPPSYISRCVETLSRFEADNVGGIIKTQPGRNSLVARAIATSISHPFGVGLSWFRISTNKPRVVDTVPFGCFRKDIFEKIGEFDEELARNEDIDFNHRIREGGGKVVLNPDIYCYYYARGTVKEFVRHNFSNGYLVTAPWGIGKGRSSARHLMPVAFLAVLSALGLLSITVSPARVVLLGLLLSYLALTAVATVDSSVKKREVGLLFVMPITFAVLHSSYAAGSLWGLWSVLKSKLRRR